MGGCSPIPLKDRPQFLSGQLCEPGEACTPWDYVLVDIFDKGNTSFTQEIIPEDTLSLCHLGPPQAEASH